MLIPGTRLGVYEVLSTLGEGGMGAVYRARDTKLNRDVAIKVLLPEVASSPERLARARWFVPVFHVGAVMVPR